ncbi:unnamed protein product [Cuscuta europaea]|uniref:Uncharacterized protein n=1 Tax=Cuscuta europaea TaxID=41803 RepID=A0A9P0YMF0_CUSEU|nr:unnamed protein product [Cuscuta europaea]
METANTSEEAAKLLCSQRRLLLCARRDGCSAWRKDCCSSMKDALCRCSGVRSWRRCLTSIKEPLVSKPPETAKERRLPVLQQPESRPAFVKAARLLPSSPVFVFNRPGTGIDRRTSQRQLVKHSISFR